MGNGQGRKTRSTQLTAKSIALLKESTKYSEEEIREWHAGFLHDCPSGKFNKEKFVEIYKQFYPNGNAEEFCKYSFTAFDANDDGFVDFEEFLLAISISKHGSFDDRLGFAFDIYDISNDGQIDQKELSTILSAMYDLLGETNRQGNRDPKTRAAQIIARLDINGDKKISKEEFIAGCKLDPVLRQLLAPNS